MVSVRAPERGEEDLGEEGDGKQGTDGTAFQCVNFVIALQGIYPSRNLRQYGDRRDQRRPLNRGQLHRREQVEI